MGMLHHWEDDEKLSFEELRDNYIHSVEGSSMSSLNEIRNVHNDSDFLTAKEFCRKYGLLQKDGKKEYL